MDLLFTAHRPRATREYRQRVLALWADWRPDLLPSERSPNIDELLLPPPAAQKALSKGPRPVDVICVGLIGEQGQIVALLLPPGWGKTEVALELCGLQFDQGSHELHALRTGGFRLFCSDVAWISTLTGRMCICRPQAELLIAAWDLAREHTRRLIGISQFEADRHLPMELRTQAAIFRQVRITQLLAKLETDCCYFPDVLIIPKLSSAPRDYQQSSSLITEVQDVLERSLRSQAIYESRFWGATPQIDARIHDIVAAVKFWPDIRPIDQRSANSIRCASEWVKKQVVSDRKSDEALLPNIFGRQKWI